jgi:hypothetical protein
MTRTSVLAALVIVAIAVSLEASQAPSPVIPEPSPYSRVAAVRFALQNGWPFPKTNLVVAIDAFFGAVDGTPVRQSVVDEEKEALEIAKLLNPNVKTARAASRLDCPTGRQPCYATDVTVLVVSGLWEGNTPGANIDMYSPGGARSGDPSSMTLAVIDLEHRDAGRVGTRYRLGPSTLMRRR